MHKTIIYSNNNYNINNNSSTIIYMQLFFVYSPVDYDKIYILI